MADRRRSSTGSRGSGKIDREEMYRVFNMGIGMTFIVRPDSVSRVQEVLRGARLRLVGVPRKSFPVRTRRTKYVN